MSPAELQTAVNVVGLVLLGAAGIMALFLGVGLLARRLSIRSALRPSRRQRRRQWREYKKWAEAQEHKGKPL